MDNINLDGKVAFVTGAASGIGRATAQALAGAGAKVMLVDIDKPGLEETAHQIGDPARCALIRADVRVIEDVQKAVADTIARFGQLDLAHNNAGIFGPAATIIDYPAEMFAELLRSNVYSVFLCMQAELPHMLSRKSGAIVNTSSASGLRATTNVSGYTTSKHALIGLTRAAALEYGAQGIRINALCPGFVRTPLTAVMGEEGEEAVRQANPMQRVAEPDEIARAVLWLLSDHSAYMTGSNLVIDGGFTIG